MNSHACTSHPSAIRSAIVTAFVTVAALTALGCVSLPYLAPEDRERIVAIDVALEADRTPADPSTTVRSHITLVQGFVRETNVHAITASVAMVMATTDLERLTVKTIGSSASGSLVDPTPELRRLQERMVDAFKSYAVAPADDLSLIVTPDGAPFGTDAIYRVTNFVSGASGVNYRPHIVAGAGQQAPASTAFTPMGAALYELDHAGIAQRAVWRWTGDIGAR